MSAKKVDLTEWCGAHSWLENWVDALGDGGKAESQAQENSGRSDEDKKARFNG